MEKITVKVFSFALLTLFFSIKVLSQTTITTGSVSGTWSFNESPYFIEGDITINYDSTLIIEPGVIVEFQGHYKLNVHGVLLAEGTKTDTIYFTINDTTGFANPDTSLGGWNGIKFTDIPIESDSSKLIYCKISYGKSFGDMHPENCGGGLFISNFDKILIANSLITNCRTAGINSPSGGAIYLAQSNIKFMNNEISGNRAWDGGAMLIWESAPVFHNNLIAYNMAEIGGGGIWIGGNSNPVFNSDTIRNNISGENGGGIICWQNTSTILNSVNVNSNKSNWGAGVGVINCEIEMNSCVFESNRAKNLGGGIAADYSNISLHNSNFIENHSDFQSGALHGWNSELFVDNCSFKNNYAEINYGGIGADSCSVIINNSLFQSNSTVWGGGLAVNFGSLEITDSYFKDNNAEHGGGFISGWSNNYLSNVTFEQNRANWGGAMSITNCNLNISDCDFQNNQADEAGVFEYIADTLDFQEVLNVDIVRTNFSKNNATGAVGVFRFNQNNTENSLVSINIEDCSIINNSADRVNILISSFIKDFKMSNTIITGNNTVNRTGVCNFSGNVTGTVENCVFNSNSTFSGSSAASVGSNSNVDFANCTFVNNYGQNGAAITVRNNSSILLFNSILWGNEPYNSILAAVTDSTPCVLDIYHSDIQYGIDSLLINDSISVINWGDGNIISDPLFIDTSNFDYHLSDLSPCIGAGIDSLEINDIWYFSALTDIEGNLRPNPSGSNPDMGAYENSYGIPTDVINENTIRPLSFELEQNYPNPFNPVTTIKYQLPANLAYLQAGVKSEHLPTGRQGANVKLIIYDILGKEVRTLVNEIQKPGNYEVNWEANDYPTGIYFYRLITRDFIETKKMILLK
ncbi:MAG: right-handed parallel beta-helix repeat-containing protein [Melioribacteraceae bacterium]|nr:right-handed parallel beta-helix repeat-containing protein [Melioribacteraceae bacterium]